MHIHLPAPVMRLGGLFFAACGGADIMLAGWAALNGDGAVAWTLFSVGSTALGIVAWGAPK